MAVDTDTLVQVLDEAVTNGMENAIKKYGSNFSDQEKKDLLALTPQQTKDALANLLEASKTLGKLLWFDNNNNNN